jgi:hypothetical protein
MSFAGKWTELETIMLSGISWAQKDKWCIFSLICRTHKYTQTDMNWKGGLLRGRQQGGRTREGDGRSMTQAHYVQEWKSQKPIILYNKLIFKNHWLCQVLVPHTYNPSYSGGRDQKDWGLKSARANNLWGFISKVLNTKKG